LNSPLSALATPLIGIFGVLVGIALNEYLRRRNRVEQYAVAVFQKRLGAYEKLADLINNGSEIAGEVIDNPKLSKEERHNLISSIIIPIAEFTDKNRLYIDEDLGAHCTALFMGVEDIYDATKEEKEALLKSFYSMRTETYRMIKEDSGLARINSLFHSINRPLLSSPVIDRIRHLRSERRSKEK
jgi:hypothetical protein